MGFHYILNAPRIPCLSTCTHDNPLAKARGLSPRTGGQPMVELSLNFEIP